MKNFIKISKYAGMREDLVQASGGNSAYKFSSDKMAIKASGYQLADVNGEIGYSIVNPQIIRERFLNAENLEMMTEEDSKKIIEEAYIEGARPSIETFLHSICGKYSLHTHSIMVNVLTCRKNGKEEILKMFPDALIVPYATPGIELAKAYFKGYKQYIMQKDKEPKEIFLMNHGFLTSAETAEEVIDRTEYVTKRIEEYLGLDMSAYHNMMKLNELFDEGILWNVTDINVLTAYHEFEGTWNACFCPDCVVFLGKKMYVSPIEINQKDFDIFVENNGYPVIVEFRNNLYIHAESVKKALEIQSVLSFSAQVMMLNIKNECSMLTEEEKNFLLNWDAEKYRKNMK